MFPPVAFGPIELGEANAALTRWGHRMGPLRRRVQGDRAWGLFHAGHLVGVATTSSLIRPNVAKRPDLTRANTIELSRLCADRPHLCRVVLRLWREFVFPDLPHDFAISYQDADLHSGNTYRFDGWRLVGRSRSGTDSRSGRRGRNKRIWGWPASICEEAAA